MTEIPCRQIFCIAATERSSATIPATIPAINLHHFFLRHFAEAIHVFQFHNFSLIKFMHSKYVIVFGKMEIEQKGAKM